MTGFTERRSVRAAAAVLAIALAVAIGVLIGRGAQPAEPEQQPGGTQRLSAADIGFAQDMIAHHQQALQMVELLGPDLSVDVRGIATQIQLSQSREIGVLMGWLEVLGEPLQNPNPMAWMTDEPPASSTPSAPGGHAGHAMPATTSNSASPAPTMQHAMPGMATSEELTALTTASGVQQEVRFLQLMLRHHQGGVDMAGYAQRGGDAPAVRQRATAMAKGQSDEISMMLVQLTARNATSLPYP
ncbi:DUF305 domain-containing protein [Tsukamurella hominis]|uniref:DUF305 domain-containing protein n=1 Tax=Tsukamurella hominis TaxID=1970232 RepID=UPI0039EB4FDA